MMFTFRISIIAFSLLTVFQVFPETVFAASNEEILLREIRFYGNREFSRELMLHFCRFDEGKIYTQEELDRRIKLTYEGLYNSLYFSQINIFDLPRSVQDEAVILVDVREGSPWHADASIWSISAYRDNIGGRGFRLGFTAGDSVSDIYFLQPWFMGTNLYLGGRSYFESGKQMLIEDEYDFGGESYYSEVFGIENEIGYAFTSRAKFGVKAVWERHDFYRLNFKAAPHRRFGIQRNLDEVFLKPYLKFDKRDSDKNPTEGAYLFSEFQIANEVLGAYSFYKYSGETRFYVYPFELFVAALRMQGGVCSGETPYFELYDISGIEGIRAEGYNNFVGDKMAIVSFEIRRHLISTPLSEGWFEGVLFSDVGRTWDKNEEVALDDIAYSYGVGLRLYLRKPFNIDARLEYGFGKENKLIATVYPTF